MFRAQQIADLLESNHALTHEQIQSIESDISKNELIIAGAGSGKTQVMTYRVLYAIINKFVRPHEILCLTFTNKATKELNERVNKALNKIREIAKTNTDLKSIFDDIYIPPTISTYDAFMNTILKEFGYYIGIDSDFDITTMPTQIKILESIIDELVEEKINELMSPDPIYEHELLKAKEAIMCSIGILDGLNSNLKTLDQLVNYIEKAINHIENLKKEYHKNGNEKNRPADVKSLLSSLKYKSVCMYVIKKYKEKKLESNSFTFSDLPFYLDLLIQQNKTIANILNERYKLVTLDEYQDTSVAQSKIISTIFSNTPVTAVGDPKQSIYSWRGASVNSIKNFEPQFGKCEIKTLSQTFRNSSKILEVANRIASKLPEVQNAGKLKIPDLTSTPSKFSNEGVDIEFCLNEQEQAEYITNYLKTRTTNKESVVILCRTKNEISLLQNHFDQNGISYKIAGDISVLQEPIIQDILSYIACMDSNKPTFLLRLLINPVYNLSAKDIKVLNGELYKKKSEIDDKREKDAYTLINLIDELLIEKPKHINPAVFELAEVLKDLRQHSYLPLPLLLNYILSKTNLLVEAKIITNSFNVKYQDVENTLSAFKDFLNTLPSEICAYELIDWIERLEYDEISIDGDVDDDSSFDIDDNNENVVLLSTIHKAKGLEWDTVIIPSLRENHFPTKQKGNWITKKSTALPYPMRGDYQDLPQLDILNTQSNAELKEIIAQFKEESKEFNITAERRLMYVGVTRARKKLLLLTYSIKQETEKGAGSSIFFNEIYELIHNKKFDFAEVQKQECKDETNHLIDPIKNYEAFDWPSNSNNIYENTIIKSIEFVEQMINKPSFTCENGKTNKISYEEKLSENKYIEKADRLIEKSKLLNANNDHLKTLLPNSVSTTILSNFIYSDKKNKQAIIDDIIRPIPHIKSDDKNVSIGIELHEIIENYLQKDLQNPARDETIDTKSITDQTLKNYIDIFNTVKNDYLKDKKTLETEYGCSLATSINGVCKELKLQIDAIFIDDKGVYHIVDWKSSYSGNQNYNTQLAIYAHVISSIKNININNIKTTIYNAKRGKFIQIDIENISIADAVESFYKTFYN